VAGALESHRARRGTALTAVGVLHGNLPLTRPICLPVAAAHGVRDHPPPASCPTSLIPTLPDPARVCRAHAAPPGPVAPPYEEGAASSNKSGACPFLSSAKRSSHSATLPKLFRSSASLSSTVCSSSSMSHCTCGGGGSMVGPCAGGRGPASSHNHPPLLPITIPNPTWPMGVHEVDGLDGRCALPRQGQCGPARTEYWISQPLQSWSTPASVHLPRRLLRSSASFF
jgi:hypothetical protein